VTTVLSSALPRIDIRVRAGQALEVTIPVLDGDGDPAPAASFTAARAQVRAGIDGAVLHTFSTASGGAAITGASAAVVVLSATSEQTAEWATEWSTLTTWWDLEITDADDAAHQLTAPGLLTVTRQVTR
jgi:hypothetical protein